ncbi:TadE/TadG family protein [Klebsiella sp. RHBSTW-00484]|uniref:pilus assembly protein n=1 Tax=unclassified Klebsiella TaxID=2608929 RepID=UPI0015E558BD|nr:MULTISPECIES: pilus assembly protein [unclassified Klebsiella]QLO35965.1 TadE/TadG family protein [Klebsiella sp. RHBSTW-00484]QLT75481.1 TadE/TadG family protein [Klebsiella sp. RHBSTW-00464]
MKCSKLHLLKFFRKNKGSIAVSFALMLPALMGFYSLVVDGARFNSERSRLADALNQSVYAVAVADNRNQTPDARAENIAKVGSYLTYYFPDKTIDTNSISVDGKLIFDEKNILSAVDYKVNADQITHPILKLSETGSMSGFHSNVTLRGNGLSGTVRRTTVTRSIPTDYVFVVDFSGSMTSSSAERGLSREQLLKKVVTTLGEQIFELDNGSTIGFVPYSYGVPVRLDKTNYSSPQGKEVGCTHIAKMKSDFESLDWDFWYNKPKEPKGRAGRMSLDDFIKLTDSAQRNYYMNVIAKANRQTDSWLISQGYCVKQNGSLLCDADSKSNIHNPANAAELNRNFNNFLRFTLNASSYNSLLNSSNVDIEGTLSGDYLFSEKNVKTYVSSLGAGDDIPFGYGGCYYSIPERNNLSENIRDLVQPAYYLMDLSSDPSVLSEFSAMTPEGGTESLWGLLRAVPLLAKGKNERKMMFVVSDGLDSYPALRQNMMTNYNLCGVIREGLKKYPEGTPTTSASIYYISLINNSSPTEWANSCVGNGNAYTATNLNDLTNVIGSLMFQNSISYINPDETEL